MTVFFYLFLAFSAIYKKWNCSLSNALKISVPPPFFFGLPICFDGALQFKFYAMKGVFPLLTVYFFLKGVVAGKFKRGLRMSFLRFIVTPLSHYASYSSEGKKKCNQRVSVVIPM